MAMAPPFTLIRSCGMFSACMKRSTTLANASFSSNRSISSFVMPARCSSLFATNSGPVNMIIGSLPMLAMARMRARGLRPYFSPISLLPIRMAAAPSTMPDELPPWWTWLIFSTSG